MPQLPSGLHVGVCFSPVLDAIKKGDFGLRMKLVMALRDVDDIRQIASLVYYRNVNAEGRPIDEYAPGYNLVDVDQKEVGWSDSDYVAFAEWQKLPVFKVFLSKSFTEIQEAVHQMKVELPKSLHGLLD